jgi:uncharacterized protein
MNRKLIFRWLKILLIIYAMVGIVFYYVQDRIYFHPEPLKSGYTFPFKIPFREKNIQYNRESNINIVQFLPADSVVRGVVLYFHGNKRNIERYAQYAPQFTKHAYEVWMIDYPGFGKSTGNFNEQVLYDWALELYKLARTRFTRDSIIIYGKSFGTGLATQLASIRDCRHLILETPYYDFRSLTRRYLPLYPLKRMIPYNFPTYKYLQKVDAPVTIFHGTDDGIIPYSNSARLKPYLKPGGEFITIEDGEHNNLYQFEAVTKKLDSILRQ